MASTEQPAPRTHRFRVNGKTYQVPEAAVLAFQKFRAQVWAPNLPPLNPTLKSLSWSAMLGDYAETHWAEFIQKSGA